MVGETNLGAGTPEYDAHTHALLNRLRRTEGQVRGLQRMVESDASCIDVPDARPLRLRHASPTQR